jgi:hypothetical protein
MMRHLLKLESCPLDPVKGVLSVSRMDTLGFPITVLGSMNRLPVMIVMGVPFGNCSVSNAPEYEMQ